MPEHPRTKHYYRRLLYAGGYVLAIMLFSACSSTPMTRAILDQQAQYPQRKIELHDVPFFAQEAYQCGPAALATILSHSGIGITANELAPKVYLPGKKGTLQIELMAATRRYGRMPYLLEPSMQSLLKQLKAGKPVLVFQNLGLQWIPQWHFSVVIGYDLDERKLILRSGKERRYIVDMHLFERTWMRTSYWAFIALKPGELPANGDARQYFKTVADYEKARTDGNAIKAYRIGHKHWPTSQLLGMGLGNALYQSGMSAQAAVIYTRVINHHPQYAPAHNNLAQVMLELGKLNVAKQHAEIAVSIGGEHQQQYQSTLTQILSTIKQAHPSN